MGALLDLNRRVIFLMVAAAMIVPLYRPLAFPGLSVTPPVRAIYDRIEALPPGANLLVSFDFDLSSRPELEPQARAVLTHAFRRGLDVVAMGLWQTGQGLAQQVVRDCARKAGKTEGTGYAYLGWQPGGASVIIGLGQEIARTFPKDARGEPTADLPILQDVKSLQDFQYLISFGAGDPGVDAWVVYGGDRHHVPMAAGTTSVNAAGLTPYLQQGQLNGMLNGMKGAAEYESLLGVEGTATGGMDSIALGGFLMLFLVGVANLAYLLTKRGRSGP